MLGSSSWERLLRLKRLPQRKIKLWNNNLSKTQVSTHRHQSLISNNNFRWQTGVSYNYLPACMKFTCLSVKRCLVRLLYHFRPTKFYNTQLLTELISCLCLVIRFEHNLTVTKPSSSLDSPYSTILPLILSSCQCYTLIISSRPVL